MLRSLRFGIENLEQGLVRWIDRHGADAMRWAFGIVFLWFGVLKLWPGLCDVEALAAKTVGMLTFGLVPMRGCILMLAALEMWIGASLLLNKGVRLGCWLLVGHLLGTFIPLMMFPADAWKHFPYAPTLTGQYILKNLILVSAALLVAAKALRRGEGQLVEMPQRVERSVA
ncbi:MAG: hypothetical protein ABI142_05145 [Bryocella sp.]